SEVAVKNRKTFRSCPKVDSGRVLRSALEEILLPIQGRCGCAPARARMPSLHKRNHGTKDGRSNSRRPAILRSSRRARSDCLWNEARSRCRHYSRAALAPMEEHPVEKIRGRGEHDRLAV